MEEEITEYSCRQLGEYLVVEFSINNLDFFIGAKIRTSLSKRIEENEFDFKNIIVDMRYIETIDSTGLALLSFLSAKTRKEKEGKVYLFKASDKIVTIMKLTSMTTFFTFIDEVGLEKLKNSTD
jgi:anti-anti-sigma factor